MRNLFMLFAVIGMVSCGTSEGECENHESPTDTVVVVEETVEETTLDVTKIENVSDLLDTLQAIPSEPTVE